jgi:hypothetical protein
MFLHSGWMSYEIHVQGGSVGHLHRLLSIAAGAQVQNLFTLVTI